MALIYKGYPLSGTAPVSVWTLLRNSFVIFSLRPDCLWIIWSNDHVRLMVVYTYSQKQGGELSLPGWVAGCEPNRLEDIYHCDANVFISYIRGCNNQKKPNRIAAGLDYSEKSCFGDPARMINSLLITISIVYQIMCVCVCLSVRVRVRVCMCAHARV